MIHAYSELYLSDAKENLGECMDYVIRVCGMKPELFVSFFLQSGYAEQFERGNPAVVAGMSGAELAEKIISSVYAGYSFPRKDYSQERSDAYWAGWALAEYQWLTARRFKDIFSRVTLDEILKMYRVYHEMDIARFAEELDRRIDSVKVETHLKSIRESRGISQAELSRISGVKLRSIQLYEQRVNDIDRAQAATLYKLSRVLGCTVEELLEKPER